MGHFLLLFRGGNAETAGLSASEVEDYYGSWTRWAETLQQQQLWRGGHPLEDEGRVLGPNPSAVTDGPFAETKEVLGGYIMIETEDMARAVEVGQQCPIFRVGGRVEVRRVSESPICPSAETLISTSALNR